MSIRVWKVNVMNIRYQKYPQFESWPRNRSRLLETATLKAADSAFIAAISSQVFANIKIRRLYVSTS